MTTNQLLALRPGCKVRVIRPGDDFGQIRAFLGRANKWWEDWSNTKYAIVRLSDISARYYLPADIEHYIQGE